MPIIRFVRKDGEPDEDHLFVDLEDALYHMDMFQEDDSGLYEKIVLFDEDGNEMAGIYFE